MAVNNLVASAKEHVDIVWFTSRELAGAVFRTIREHFVFLDWPTRYSYFTFN